MANLGANLIWMAYCSGSYLRTPNRLLPIPGLPVREVISAFACEDKSTVFEDDLALPRHIDFLTLRQGLDNEDVHQYLSRTEANARSRFHRHLPAGEKDGQLKAQYIVLAHTNILGVAVPLSFHYVQYHRTPRDSWGKQLEVSAKVLELRTSRKPSPVLRAHALQHVIDMRFRHPVRRLDSIAYTLTNSVLPPTNDARLVKLYEEAAAMRPVDRLASSRQGDSMVRAVFVLFIVILLFVPLVIRKASHIKSQTSKTVKGIV